MPTKEDFFPFLSSSPPICFDRKLLNESVVPSSSGEIDVRGEGQGGCMRDEDWRLEINLVELSGSGRSPRDPPTTPCAHMGPVRADTMAKMATSARSRKECVQQIIGL